MLRKLFGSSEPSGWASAPDGLRAYVEEKLTDRQLVGLDRVLQNHEVFSRVGAKCWNVDATTQLQVLSFALLDAHWDFVRDSPSTLEGVTGSRKSDAQTDARWLVYASILLNSEPWNPAWSWNLYYGSADLDDAQKKRHVSNTMQASDEAVAWYIRLLGRQPAYDLVFPNIRALAVSLQMELVLLERLTTSELEVYVSVMAREGDGVPIKRSLLRVLAAVPGSSEEVLDFGLRWASHVVHLTGLELLGKYEFGKVLPVERCAAAINPQHLPSRLDLALLLRDLSGVDQESGYAEEARHYAREALELIDEGQYDLGPNSESNMEDDERANQIEEMKRKMLDIVF